MAKVYISYNNRDSAIASKISESLKDAGHEILIDVDTLLPGQDISSTLFDALRQSDFMIVIISENSVDSKWVQNEIGAALSYSAERKNFGLFPLVVGSPQIPDSIRHKLYIQVTPEEVDLAATRVLDAINKFQGRRAAIKERGEEKKKNTDDYIMNEISKLEKKQVGAKRIYYLWNVIGFFTLVISTIFLLSKLSDTAIDISSSHAVAVIIKSILVVSFLIAMSRYSFLMGKIALDESITLGERIHAISFGKVFIQMFSDDFTKEEMYKVFENWNTTPSKGADNYKAEDYDPNLIKVITELVKVIKK
ncbi:toll/interleukin-1 receptor domain-containing protein [Pseudoalteromonas fenneropenaei]|uniref:Toll/interleukin-1 receptor domain-containing protein n=1 Tax=Pseudoalteromonas fenneropenaei TaxID=1737459 RepID=A0ABV7CI53_9GAMM